jgi:hypothetical protein
MPDADPVTTYVPMMLSCSGEDERWVVAIVYPRPRPQRPYRAADEFSVIDG